MKVVIDARIIYTSTGRPVEHLLEHLQQLDHDNEYIVLLFKKDMERWQPKAPNFHKVQADYPIYSFAEQLQFAWLLYRLKPDLVHFTMPQRPLLYVRKQMIMIHDLTLFNFVNARKESPLRDLYKNRIKPAVFRLLIRINVRQASHLTTGTEFVRTQLIEQLGVSPKKITVTPEAVDQYANAPEAIPELIGKKFLLFIGNAFPYKNLQRLIDAFVILDRPHLTLVLAGKPNFFTGELQRYVEEKGIKNVFFAGFVSNAEQAWLNENAELYTFPSLSEGFSLTGLEAMYSGLPVVSSNASCLPEVYADAAAYFDPLDTTDMANVIGELLDSPARRKELIKKGKLRVKQFSWKRMSEQTLAIYNTLLKPR